MEKVIKFNTTSVYEPRALAELVGLANQFTSHIMLAMGNRQVNAKSIMGIMGLGLDVDKEIIIYAQGEDETQAVAAIEAFLTEN